MYFVIFIITTKCHPLPIPSFLLGLKAVVVFEAAAAVAAVVVVGLFWAAAVVAVVACLVHRLTS